jgi:hypothetical protein
MTENRRQLHSDLIFIFALGLIFRIALLLLFPVPYGNDAAGRLYYREAILTWHWLPVTQALVHATFAVTHSIGAVRLVFAIAGSLAAVAFAFYLQAFASRRAALIGGVLFAINAQAVYLSLMPFQEIVFLGLLFGGLAFFVRENAAHTPARDFKCGSILYGLACLTRYEAWFILPALLLTRMWRTIAGHRTRTMLAEGIKSSVGLFWGPALWCLVNWQHWGSPTAFLFHHPDRILYAWAPHAEALRVLNYTALLFYWLIRFGSPLVLLALPGVWLVWKNRRTMLPALWPLLLLLLLVLLFLVFIAGREFATANRFVMIPLGITLIFVALSIDDLIKRAAQSSRPLLQKLANPVSQTGIAVVLVLLLLLYSAVPVMQSNRLADYREPYEIARFLEAHLAREESAVIVATSFAGEVPMPYQRVFGQLELEKERLLCSFLIEPQKLANIESFVRGRNLRYVVVFGTDDQSRGEDEVVFLQFVADPRNNMKRVLSNRSAVIYERLVTQAAGLREPTKLVSLPRWLGSDRLLKKS